MTLRDDFELENTRRKLRLLEERYAAAKMETDGNEHVRTLSMQSLRRTMNQLKEEIARYVAHASSNH